MNAKPNPTISIKTLSKHSFNILEKLPGMVSVRDELTKTQYAYLNTTMGGLVSYDDEEAICDKTEYCLENELHGKCRLVYIALFHVGQENLSQL